MKKFAKIDALIESQALSTKEIIKHWVETKKLNIGEIIGAYTCFPINRANLQEITFGMIWYTDDTVSRELRPDKTVKSIVLETNLEYHIIYGDTFIEKHDISRDEMELFLDEHPEVELATEQRFAQLTQRDKELNKILSKIGKPTWRGRTYWCAENVKENGMTKAHSLPLHIALPVDAGENQDFHPIYEKHVLY